KIVRGLLKSDVKLMAVVKSNAYGHGLAETAKLFCEYGADWIGVDNLDEAMLLRKNNIIKPVLVLGFTSDECFSEAAKNKIRLTVYNDLPKSTIPNTYPAIHLKIDTGMSRQGVTLDDLPAFLKKIPSGINIEGVFTHFANADNLEDRSYSDLQVFKFKKVLRVLEKFDIKPVIVHASATTGLLAVPNAQFDMVRAGIALYGLWPSLEFAKKFNSPVGGLGLKPALSWKTRVVQIKKIKKNTPVGYGISEKVKKDTRIAVLPVGYYDGYFRKLSSTSEVLIGGRRCKVLGRISMNLSVVDISNVENVQIWDEVVLIGSQNKERITAEELAQKADTISYEVVSRINPLLPRIYI
ncbi:MAG: alanine racemase, partial [Patescibacteria group bacterium]